MAKKVELSICMGSSCFSRGNNLTLQAVRDYLKENGLENEVHLSGNLCQGKCASGPNLEVDGCSCGEMTVESALDVIEASLKNRKE
jgi:NADH:ubiquinone oxidoreductase subunit E